MPRLLSRQASDWRQPCLPRKIRDADGGELSVDEFLLEVDTADSVSRRGLGGVHPGLLPGRRTPVSGVEPQLAASSLAPADSSTVSIGASNT